MRRLKSGAITPFTDSPASAIRQGLIADQTLLDRIPMGKSLEAVSGCRVTPG
jgi:hypothetical protein